jgi:Protein of unknown function (DUF3089)
MTQPASKQKIKPAAKFLLVIVVLIGIFIVVAIGIAIWFDRDPSGAMRFAYTPTHTFDEDTADAQPDYTLDASWAALPGIQSEALAAPEGEMAATMIPEADVFFVHPTTYLNRDHWNAPVADAVANDLIANRVLKIQASAFNLAGRIYAPRYRQATFGAFFDETGDGVKALQLAQSDVLAAFDNFIARRSEGRPFILAGHSQGSLHLLHLLQERIAGTPLQSRMIAAYIIGWPISIEADLGAMPGISACESSAQTGCVISYQTFGKGGVPKGLLNYMDTSIGLGGAPRKGTQMLCTNPQNWLIGSAETQENHLGALMLPKEKGVPLEAPIGQFAGSRCGPDGVLYLTGYIDENWRGKNMARTLPGENFHVYDYHLFYMHIRQNAAERTQAWLGQSRLATTETGQQ